MTMTVTDAIGEWRAYRKQMVALRLVAESTFDNQSAICLQLERALGAHPLDGLRKSHIELWMGERLQTCSPVTVRGEMNVLRQIIRWCIDEGRLAVAPRFPKLAVPAVEAALPSDAAFLWVLAHVPSQHAAALEFMMLTGLSPHELERVQVRDGVAPAGRVSGIRTLGIGQREDFPVKQPSRRRWVPLNGRARDLWFQASAGRMENDPVFPNGAATQKAIRRASGPGAMIVYDGTVCGREQAYRIVREANLITPKLMRKWFASKVAGEQPEHVLQRLMGHAPGSPITRRHYVRSSDAQMGAAVQELRP